MTYLHTTGYFVKKVDINKMPSQIDTFNKNALHRNSISPQDCSRSRWQEDQVVQRDRKLPEDSVNSISGYFFHTLCDGHISR